ncbi:hypothetical protein HDV05_006606 [Chytridiales sp. JEL 0842]|nr:hypothetical protein HDV05_006606 [Chytridiales sp. JEL 0842]
MAALENKSKMVDKLLLIMLPESLIPRLESSNFYFSTVSERINEAFCIFIDFYDAKDIKSINSELTVKLLNTTFIMLDEIIAKYPKIEKIKTISSKAMLMAIPIKGEREETAESISSFCERVYAELSQLENEIRLLGKGPRRNIRIGISMGPVTAGIVGMEKFCYDIYGDSVNTASRMQTLGVGTILSTVQFYKALPEREQQKWKSVGTHQVKGKGSLLVYEFDLSKTTTLAMSNTVSHSLSDVNKGNRLLSEILNMQQNLGGVDWKRSSVNNQIQRRLMSRRKTKSSIANESSGVLPTSGESLKALPTYPLSEEAGSAYSLANSKTSASNVILPVAQPESAFNLSEKSAATIAQSVIQISDPPPENGKNQGVQNNGVKILETGLVNNLQTAFQFSTLELSAGVNRIVEELIEFKTYDAETLRLKINDYLYTFYGNFKDPAVENECRQRGRKYMVNENQSSLRSKLGITVVYWLLLIPLDFFYNQIGFRWFHIALVGIMLLTFAERQLWRLIAKKYRVVSADMLIPKLDKLLLQLQGPWFFVTTLSSFLNTWLITAFSTYGGIEDASEGLTYIFLTYIFTVKVLQVPIMTPHLLGWTCLLFIEIYRAVMRSFDLVGFIHLLTFMLMLTHVDVHHNVTAKTDFIISRVLQYNHKKGDQEMLLSAGLLAAILPPRVMNSLLMGVECSSIIENFENITLLHLDVVSFTTLSSVIMPDVLLEMLNKVFTEFDAICRSYSIEKIITIGDAYIAAMTEMNGVSIYDAAVATCKTALDMQVAMSAFQSRGTFELLPDSTMKIRIGITSGRAFGFVSGGLTKVKYELMGSAVVVAEKVQEVATPGNVMISESTRKLLAVASPSGSFTISATGAIVAGEQMHVLSATILLFLSTNILIQASGRVSLTQVVPATLPSYAVNFHWHIPRPPTALTTSSVTVNAATPSATTTVTVNSTTLCSSSVIPTFSTTARLTINIASSITTTRSAAASQTGYQIPKTTTACSTTTARANSTTVQIAAKPTTTTRGTVSAATANTLSKRITITTSVSLSVTRQAGATTGSVQIAGVTTTTRASSSTPCVTTSTATRQAGATTGTVQIAGVTTKTTTTTRSASPTTFSTTSRTTSTATPTTTSTVRIAEAPSVSATGYGAPPSTTARTTTGRTSVTTTKTPCATSTATASRVVFAGITTTASRVVIAGITTTASRAATTTGTVSATASPSVTVNGNVVVASKTSASVHGTAAAPVATVTNMDALAMSSARSRSVGASVVVGIFSVAFALLM